MLAVSRWPDVAPVGPWPTHASAKRDGARATLAAVQTTDLVLTGCAEAPSGALPFHGAGISSRDSLPRVWGQPPFPGARGGLPSRSVSLPWRSASG